MKITKEEHKDRHILLHQHLDELVADWISKTEGYPSKSSITDLIQWSYKQTLNPDENWFDETKKSENETPEHIKNIFKHNQ